MRMLTRRYRVRERLVEDFEDFFRSPGMPDIPIYHLYMVQMRVCFLWLTIKAFYCRDDQTAKAQAYALLHELNRSKL